VGGSGRALAAVDLGAESGRVVVGHLSEGLISLEIVHRFDNRPVRFHDGLHWNLPEIFAETLTGLARAAGVAGPLDGIGIDGWGVDYALLDDGGRMLGLPYHYRDERVSADVIERVHAHVPRPELYSRIGIQTMSINTIFQLMAEAGGAAASAAERIALVPDLLGLWLTGELVNEATIASTTGLLEARGARWARDLIARLGLPQRPFAGEVAEPGLLLGRVLAEHADAAGGACGSPVWTVAAHDTASAFVAAPLNSPNAAVLSSGTWSLLGLEVNEPSLGPDAAAFNLTNERGLNGTVRLLRNVMGLWLLQECRREWRATGAAYDYDTLHRLAHAAQDDVPLFDPDQESLLRGGGMPAQIVSACTAAGQPAPATPGELVRSILVSLACKYRLVLEQLRVVSGRAVEVVHIVGGGARNVLLCQLTSDLLGLPVLAGPEEATALGNVLVQALALGELATPVEMRELVARSVQLTRFEPSGARAADETYERFLAVTGLAYGQTAHATT
jgi:rhamnulokinase